MTSFAVNDEIGAPQSDFDMETARSLDLDLVLEMVSRHCGTRRGRATLTGLVIPQNTTGSKGQSKIHSLSKPGSSRNRRTYMSYVPNVSKRIPMKPFYAETIQDAQREYERVEQAMLTLENDLNLTYPPIYGAESGPFDTKTLAESDFDEFLTRSVEEWTLENVLQAEQLTTMITNTYEWSQKEKIRTWAPFLAQLLESIDVKSLETLRNELQGAVQVKRVRSLTDPSARSSFTFVLNNQRFPVLSILRQRLEDLTSGSQQTSGQVADLEAELKGKEFDITQGLFQRILHFSSSIDHAMNTIGSLDVVMAKGAYGLACHAQVPLVKHGHAIHVDAFIHPLLYGSDRGVVPVPIDLYLSQNEISRALIIGGSNGGGKTLAMKSFGLCAYCVRIGLPIPHQTGSRKRPRVDFFDCVAAAVGDKQNVEEGMSTYMSLLHQYAIILNRLKSLREGESALVLLDELGSGTEASAGGAISQAILEEMMATKACRVVATTHSSHLKALAWEHPEFRSASVTMQNPNDELHSRPAYQLQYDIVGESYALSAASRSLPSLPESVINRATELLSSDASNDGIEGRYLRALTESLEAQNKRAHDIFLLTNETYEETRKCQGALVGLATSYDRELERLEARIDHFYQRLRAEKSGVELMGETLRELQIVRNSVKSAGQMLMEEGLVPIRSIDELSNGDRVVIADGSELHGSSAIVTSVGEPLGPDQVSLVMVGGVWGEATGDSAARIFGIWQLARWGAWDEDLYRNVPPSNSVPDSRRRLDIILASIKINRREKTPIVVESHKGKKRGPSFESSRARKAAKKKKK